MGGGVVAPAAHRSTHLLIALPMSEPRSILSLLRRAHPALHITYLNLKQCSEVPPALYASATILCTSGALPTNPQFDAPHLRWIHVLSAGVDWLAHHPAYQDPSIILTTSSGAHGPQMAEWALMTRLWLSHNGRLWEQRQRSHQWDPSGTAPVTDLAGKRIGILGYGSIGRQVARVTSAAGMTVIACTASLKKTPQQKRDTGYCVPGTGDPKGLIPAEWHSSTSMEDLHDFLGANLDWLVVALPLTARTRHLLGANEFELLSHRPTFFTNLARGPVVRQDALIDALQKRQLIGAALDVTDPEPLPKDSPLWDMPNLIVTPHISAMSSSATVHALQILHRNLLLMDQRKPLLNVVDRRRGY